MCTMWRGSEREEENQTEMSACNWAAKDSTVSFEPMRRHVGLFEFHRHVKAGDELNECAGTLT